MEIYSANQKGWLNQTSHVLRPSVQVIRTDLAASRPTTSDDCGGHARSTGAVLVHAVMHADRRDVALAGVKESAGTEAAVAAAAERTSAGEDGDQMVFAVRDGIIPFPLNPTQARERVCWPCCGFQA